VLANIASSSEKSHDVSSPFSPTSSFDLVEPFVNVSIFSLKPILENLERKQKKREWELNHVFQEMWDPKLSWAKPIIGCVGKLMMVQCKVCNEIKGQEKLLVPKLNNLQKCAGRQKCKVPCPRCVVGQYFMSIDSKHAKNKWLWASKGRNTIVKMVCVGGTAIHNKCKFIQFVVIFWILKLGRPFIDFEEMKELFEFFKVKSTPHKHWSNSINW
jgi:hypothetical protein